MMKQEIREKIELTKDTMELAKDTIELAKDRKGISFLHSIKTKIVAIVAFATIVSVGLTLLMTMPTVEKSMAETIESYMLDMAVTVGEELDALEVLKGADVVYAADSLHNELSQITVRDMKSSYAYLVAKDGTMLYHPTAEKIGQPVENAVVTGLVSELQSGNKPAPDVITYVFKGADKYAAYYITHTSDILVITADKTELFQEIKQAITRCIIGAILLIVFCIVVAVIFAIRVVNPIKRATNILEDLAEMDFTEKPDIARLVKRKDETGLIGSSVEKVRLELVNTIGQVKEQSQQLRDSSNTLSMNANETSNAVEQVETAINEIAQGAGSQAEETQSATESVVLMGNMIEETNSEVEVLRTNARAMRDAGNSAIAILEELGNTNQKTREAIDIIYEQTSETNDAAMKIKEATDIISDIAEETNLLSLNASIEAARAGEAGRGFAVVAAQIQKLAEQSNESATLIDQIIHALIEESQKSVNTMEEVRQVIEQQNENVNQTQKAFQNVKSGIDASVDSIRTIAGKTEKLDEARVKVVDVVQSLTAIAEENAASTEETSASAEEVGAIMNDIAESAKKLDEIAAKLEEDVERFVIE